MRCSHVGAEFPSQTGSVIALTDLSLTATAGEFLSVIGPSGCGKSTLLRMLGGLQRPTRGTVDPGCDPRRVSLVFQNGALFPWLSVLDNAAFALEAQGLARPERQARARRMLARFGLEGRESAWPHELSAGMRQRVALARSFLSDPALLLMDEPFAALDAQTRLVLQRELLEIWEASRPSVVFVTHDVEEAILLADRVLVMSGQPGRIIKELAVPFDRSRPRGVTVSPEFAALKAELLESLEPPSNGGSAIDVAPKRVISWRDTTEGGYL